MPPFASKAVGPTFRKGWLMTWKHFLHAKYTISGMPHEQESFDNSLPRRTAAHRDQGSTAFRSSLDGRQGGKVGTCI